MGGGGPRAGGKRGLRPANPGRGRRRVRAGISRSQGENDGGPGYSGGLRWCRRGKEEVLRGRRGNRGPGRRGGVPGPKEKPDGGNNLNPGERDDL